MTDSGEQTRPLIYGYMRVELDDSDTKTRRLERALCAYAEREGYALAAIYHEYADGSHVAFAELVEELQRAEARHVVVPSMHHLGRSEPLQHCMVLHAEHHADALVLDAKVVEADQLEASQQ